MVKTRVEDLKNEPCVQCEALGHIALEEGMALLMITISPDPNYKQYQQMLPDRQYRELNKILHDKRAVADIKKYFTFYDIISEHYEFNRSGQLHSHNIVAIPSTYYPYDRNIHYISKKYASICGMQYTNSQISVNVKWITDSLIYKYLNKENAYEPIHHKPPCTIEDYWPLQPPSPLEKGEPMDLTP